MRKDLFQTAKGFAAFWIIILLLGLTLSLTQHSVRINPWPILPIGLVSSVCFLIGTREREKQAQEGFAYINEKYYSYQGKSGHPKLMMLLRDVTTALLSLAIPYALTAIATVITGIAAYHAFYTYLAATQRLDIIGIALPLITLLWTAWTVYVSSDHAKSTRAALIIILQLPYAAIPTALLLVPQHVPRLLTIIVILMAGTSIIMTAITLAKKTSFLGLPEKSTLWTRSSKKRFNHHLKTAEEHLEDLIGHNYDKWQRADENDKHTIITRWLRTKLDLDQEERQLLSYLLPRVKQKRDYDEEFAKYVF